MSANLGYQSGDGQSNLARSSFDPSQSPAAGPPPLNTQQMAATGNGQALSTSAQNTGKPTDAQAQSLINNPDSLRSYMYTQMGLDPSKPSFYSDLLDQVFLPVFAAAASLYGLGGKTGPLASMEMQVPGMLANLAHAATTPGGNMFGMAQQMGAQIASDPRFRAAIQQLSGSQGASLAEKYLEGLATLQTGGQNTLLQQATKESLQRGYAGYLASVYKNAPGAAGSQGETPGGYYGWLQSQRSNPNLSYLSALMGQ